MISFIRPLLLWVYGSKLLGLGINDVTFGHVSVVGASAGAVVALAGVRAVSVGIVAGIFG